MIGSRPLVSSAVVLGVLIGGLASLSPAQAASGISPAALVPLAREWLLPGTGLPGTLSSVSATSASNAWAVGSYCTTSTSRVQHTLIVHWNGRAWSKVASPDPGTAMTALFGVKAISARQAWAVGQYCSTGRCNSVATLILRWNGARWSRS